MRRRQIQTGALMKYFLWCLKWSPSGKNRDSLLLIESSLTESFTTLTTCRDSPGRYSRLGQVRWLYAGHTQGINTILVTHVRVRLEVCYSRLGQVHWLYAGHTQSIDTILVTHARVRVVVRYSCLGQVHWLYARHTQTIDTILVTHARVRVVVRLLMLRSSTLVICTPYANDRYDTRDARES